MQSPAREHFWDTLRAVLMLLGIPYHVALSYMVDRQWIVKSGEGVPGFIELARTISLFRMPAFYLIAGYFAAMLLARRAPGTWLKGRFKRLAIPFVTSIIVLVPILNWFCEISNLPYNQAVASWIDNSSKSGGYWMRHLWFIVVLLYFCCFIAWIAHRHADFGQSRMPAWADRLIARHMVPALLLIATVVGAWEAGAVEYFYIWGLNTNLIQEILRVDQLIIYAPWFAMGAFLQRSHDATHRLTRYSHTVLVLAVIAVMLSVTLREQVHPAMARFIDTFSAVLITQLLISAAAHLFDRPIPVVQRFTSASFVIYLFHLPLICGLVFAGQYVALPPLVKAIAVMGLTLAISYGAWIVIERSRLLALLFDGGMRPAMLARREAARADA
ncbi:acyltransferase family protein [Croceicoccus mobilis]|uniref:Glucan biosynthesis protein n=1 Tax=Croceicoccus mobilis TaxID=1703339 RepID=A0A916YZ09_9SPHN|nr:acyltransferase family protein [Croceicoccus mobilis]GGD67897.1 glucan biosynthesis protein [Croceicoccus mobilis]